MMRRTKSRLLPALLLAVAIAVTLAGYQIFSPLPFAGAPVEFTVEQGSSLRQAATQLKQAGILESDTTFVLLARLLGKAKHIRYGNYLLEKPVSRLELLDMINAGRTEQSQITIVEGISFRELRDLLNRHPKLRHDSAALSEAELLQRLGAAESAAEGLFFPDTYNFSTGSSDLAVLKRAYQTLHRHLDSAWKRRDPDLPFLSSYEALILASIVEKETGKPSDRPMIASVFINRLRIKMRLQTDPTVIYGLGDKFDGNLRKRDLLADTPYNTYTRNGLPPTPISLPGLAAIQAVMHPPQSKALYFVARGDGTSQFSGTLLEHNRAVNQFQLKR